MKLELIIKEIVKEAVREVLEEELKGGRLQPVNKPKQPKQPPTVEIIRKTTDPNSIVRPSELAEMLSVSKVTLWRWEQREQLPPRIKFGGRTVGWRYVDIEEWLMK